jgi:hypothetical protein
MAYSVMTDASVVNLARGGDPFAWLECLARGIEARVTGNT